MHDFDFSDDTARCFWIVIGGVCYFPYGDAYKMALWTMLDLDYISIRHNWTSFIRALE